MEVKKSTLLNVGILVLIVIVVAGILLFSNRPISDVETNINSLSDLEKAQIIDLTAKNGYSPSIIKASANKDTILRVNTANTFDCSSALSIPKLGIQKNLPATGQTDIILGIQKPGTEIFGTCSMGMYSFKIKFS